MNSKKDGTSESAAKLLRPLDGLKVADFGVGMAAAIVAKFLAESGAEVHRMEPAGGDPFYEVYDAYTTWRSVLASREPFSPARECYLLSSADICVIGGEDFPGATVRHDGEALTANSPRLIVLDIAAQLSVSPRESLHGADILIQARSGLVFEAHPGRPALLGFVPSAYGAALNGLVAVSAALYQREGEGRGQLVRVGLLEGALSWPLAFWGRAETETPAYSFKAPRGAKPLIFKARDGANLQLVLGSLGSKYKLYSALGINDPSVIPTDSGLPNPNDGPDKYFGDVDLLAPFVAKRDSEELLGALTEQGVVCERVLAPGACWNDPQTQSNAIIRCAPTGVKHIGQPIHWKFSGSARPVVGTSRGQGPLCGIKVIDFGAFVAGPALSVGLSDLGAEVIKVEPPGGDPLRILYSFYAAANRGKRSIALDMKTEQGLQLARRLVQGADIVCSNFRNSVAQRLGLDAAALHRTQPEKIVAINAGYGVVGPKADAPAFDPCMQAICGLGVRTGGQGNLPAVNPMMMVDLCGALLGQIGVLMALYRRARDGSGASITVPLLNAGLFLMSDITQSEGGETCGPVALLADQTGYHPAEKLYQTLDGWIAISARGEAAAGSLATAFGLIGTSDKKRDGWSEAETGMLSHAIGHYSSQAALEILQGAGVPAEVCREAGAREFIADDLNLKSGVIYEAERPVFGKTRGIGVLFSMAGASPKAHGQVSEKGEDTRAILLEAGLTQVEIEELLANKIVSGP